MKLYAILVLTALIGWLPILLSLLAVQFALANGAREWPDLTFQVTFIGLYLVLTGLGAYAYTFFDF